MCVLFAFAVPDGIVHDDDSTSSDDDGDQRLPRRHKPRTSRPHSRTSSRTASRAGSRPSSRPGSSRRRRRRQSTAMAMGPPIMREPADGDGPQSAGSSRRGSRSSLSGLGLAALTARRSRARGEGTRRSAVANVVDRSVTQQLDIQPAALPPPEMDPRARSSRQHSREQRALQRGTTVHHMGKGGIKIRAPGTRGGDKKSHASMVEQGAGLHMLDISENMVRCPTRCIALMLVQPGLALI